MKAKTISKNIQEKTSDWLSTLPLELSEKVSKKIVVTGGSIASMFLKESVNDYDMYFKDINSAILITQHYCKEWIKDFNAAKSGVSQDMIPYIRLEFKDEKSFDKAVLNFKSSESGTNRQYLKLVIHPDNTDLENFEYFLSENCVRVEIYIKSAGFLGENPDCEYKYFETQRPEDAGEYIENSLKSEESEEGEDKYRIVFLSSNAITLSNKVQLVIRFFGEPSEIHDTYDFIHATNYWEPVKGLVTNQKALEALLSKELIYSGSKYPLASIFRTRKFIKREWNCHVGNFVKMAMQLNEMDLNDPVVLEEQLTGVDAAYLHQIISAVKQKRKEDPDFQFNSAYICELCDRMMG